MLQFHNCQNARRPTRILNHSSSNCQSVSQNFEAGNSQHSPKQHQSYVGSIGQGSYNATTYRASSGIKPKTTSDPAASAADGRAATSLYEALLGFKEFQQ